MKSREIIGLMEGTIPYTDKTLSHLSDMLNKYPYFQAAHVLHTLNLHHLKDSYFLFDLRKTAVYIPDRRKLFFLIENSFYIPKLVEIEKNKKTLEDVEKIEVKEVAEVEVDEIKVAEAEINEVVEIVEIEEVDEVEIEEVEIEEVEIEEVEIEEVEIEIEDEVEIEEVDEVEIEEVDEVEIDEIEDETEVEIEVDEVEIDEEEIEEETNLEETENTEEEVASETINHSGKIEIPEKEEITDESSFDLMEDFSSKSEEKAPEEIKKKESPFASFDYISYLLSQTTENPETPPLQQQEIIDKFLETEAVSPVRIKIDLLEEPKKSKEPKEPEKTSIPFSDKTNEDTFFSETLAKIYLKQKKYDKALEIIHKLNLIYPEKNRYFADQIRFLEKLVTNTNKN